MRRLGVLVLCAALLGGCGAGAAASPSPPEALAPSAATAPSSAPSDVGGTTAPPAGANAIRIAAASDLRYAMDELVAVYTDASPGVRIDVTYGSSGNFLTQIKEGAPFDLYFSADIAYPQQLVDAGLATGSPRMYAIGKIVLWVPSASSIDVETLGMAALKAPEARKVAIANPEHAPYGKAAIAAMQHAGVYDQVKPRLVLGENISQAAQFVQAGGADIGVVALSLSVAPPMDTTGHAWQIPVDFYPTIEQGAVVLAAAQDPAVAGQFLDFVLGVDGRAVLDRYGFQLPE